MVEVECLCFFFLLDFLLSILELLVEVEASGVDLEAMKVDWANASESLRFNEDKSTLCLVLICAWNAQFYSLTECTIFIFEFFNFT